MSDEPEVDDDGLVVRPEFEPTSIRPLPSFQCTHRNKNTGDRCGKQGLMGMPEKTAKCVNHGGSQQHVREKAIARVEAAQMRLANNADVAAEVLISLTDTGTADNIRLKAAESVLNLAGIRGGQDLNLTLDVEINHADEVRERLAKLALGKLALEPEATDEEESDTIEGEVVEEYPDE